MNTIKITFPNDRGEQLAARLELPDDEQPLAYALFAHCFTCSKDFKAVVNISRALSSRRIAVLRFDFTGLGESEGDFATVTRRQAILTASSGNLSFMARWTTLSVSACWR